MSESEALRQARKGTRSCTECRRRKVRCIRKPEDAETCRSCVDRGLKCVAQVFSSRPLQTPRLPSRQRVAHLESEVAILRKAVREIQSKFGFQALDTPENLPVPSATSPGEDETDEDSNVSDVVETESPAHLRSLFQNHWLSADIGPSNEQLQDRRAKASSNLLQIAKETLQKLIPPKEEVMIMARTASKWMDLVHAVLPQPFAVTSQQELLEACDQMRKEDVDTLTLAGWLLDLAVTAQQEPQVHESPTTEFKRISRISDFSRAVSDAVESTLLSHDRLLGSMNGLGMAIHFLRFQLSLGNFRKAWIRLRHLIAIAELLGLSKAPQNMQPGSLAGLREDDIKRVQLWEFMCSADRLLGMIINRPPITRRFAQPHAQPLIVNGVLQIQLYLKRLTDITTKFYVLDDVSTPEASAQAYASALELDRELRMLASQAPKSWWETDSDSVKSKHLCQYLHYYFMMRVHLPFTMVQNPGDENMYSRLTCMEACEAVARRYESLRQMLPSGIFLSPIMDLLALTATVVLLLTSHSEPASDRIDFLADQVRVQGIAAKVLKVMEDKSRDAAGSNFARQGAITIRSLGALLQQKEGEFRSDHLNVTVPLLGNISVRRNIDRHQAPPIEAQQQAQGLPNVGLWKPTDLPSSQPFDAGVLSQGQFPATTMPTQGNVQWNPLSWSIEDTINENLFQDVFMTDNTDPWGGWQGGYHSNFQFSTS